MRMFVHKKQTVAFSVKFLHESISDSHMEDTNYHTSHLSMSPDDRTKQFPRPTAPVYAHHPQNLEEAETTQRRRGKDLTAGAKTQDDDASCYDNDICTPIITALLDAFNCQNVIRYR